jgi:hypothetical protein
MEVWTSASEHDLSKRYNRSNSKEADAVVEVVVGVDPNNKVHVDRNNKDVDPRIAVVLVDVDPRIAVVVVHVDPNNKVGVGHVVVGAVHHSNNKDVDHVVVDLVVVVVIDCCEIHQCT